MSVPSNQTTQTAFIRGLELSFVMSADSRLGTVYDTLIAAVTLTLIKERI